MGDFNSPLSPIDMSSTQKKNQQKNPIPKDTTD
jgi:hypothetical protein